MCQRRGVITGFEQHIRIQFPGRNHLTRRYRVLVGGVLHVRRVFGVPKRSVGVAARQQQPRGHRFGLPSRITATARLGRGHVIDIEREVKLGGGIHSKGVLILSSYLARTYAREQPLPLSASLVFEQSYGGVDGDSASCAELCCLQSAIADLPLRQDLAVTGSMNQLGEVQAIGGVNEKIEGFFDICNSRGLTGEQGVVIPAANRVHLMLNEEVREAVAAGRFHIYTAERVEDVMSLLSGLPAGEADSEGRYPEGSFQYAVCEALDSLRERQKALRDEGRDGNNEQKDD